jgi:hypothetical protein
MPLNPAQFDRWPGHSECNEISFIERKAHKACFHFLQSNLYILHQSPLELVKEMMWQLLFKFQCMLDNGLSIESQGMLQNLPWAVW